MSDPKQDLRATNDSIQDDAKRVGALERKKAELDPEDPMVGTISRKVEDVIDAMQDKAAAETALAGEIETSAATG